jgi:hypothetical protein
MNILDNISTARVVVVSVDGLRVSLNCSLVLIRQIIYEYGEPSKGRGFKPDGGDEFLRAIKIRSTPSFGWKVKPSVPCRKILRHVNDPLRYFRY